MSSDKLYQIEWATDVFAESPVAAAEIGLAIHRDPGTEHPVFKVTPVTQGKLENDKSRFIDASTGEEVGRPQEIKKND